METRTFQKSLNVEVVRKREAITDPLPGLLAENGVCLGDETPDEQIFWCGDKTLRYLLLFDPITEVTVLYAELDAIRVGVRAIFRNMIGSLPVVITNWLSNHGFNEVT